MTKRNLPTPRSTAAVPVREREMTCQPGQDAAALATLEAVDLPAVLNLAGSVKGLPERAQAVLALSCIGWSASRVGRALQMTKQSTLDYLSRYDPERIYRRSPAAMLAMRAAMLQTRADQVLWAMTEADLEQASLKDKAYAYCQLSTRAAAVAEAASRSATGGQGAEIEAIMDRIKKD